MIGTSAEVLAVLNKLSVIFLFSSCES